MTTTLDHTQRLNLHALIGAQRGDVATIRALWDLQDKLALSHDEEDAISLRRENGAGQERVVWDPSVPPVSKEFMFTEVEIARIRAVLVNWSAYGAAADRTWLQPLLSVFLPEPS